MVCAIMLVLQSPSLPPKFVFGCIIGICFMFAMPTTTRRRRCCCCLFVLRCCVRRCVHLSFGATAIAPAADDITAAPRCLPSGSAAGAPHSAFAFVASGSDRRGWRPTDLPCCLVSLCGPAQSSTLPGCIDPLPSASVLCLCQIPTAVQ